MKTIKHLLATTLLLASFTWAGAQANYGEFRWGLTAGANFANVSNLSEGIEKDKGRTGFVGGAFCKIPLKFYLSVRPELLFNMKGATFNFPSNVVGQTDKISFATNYMELPISFDFDLPYFLDFHAGVQGSYLISKNIKVNGTEIENDDNFNGGEFGWHVGAGVDIGNIGIHVRYQQSLTSFYDTLLFGMDEFEPRNWGITLTAAYMFASNKL